VKRLAFILLGLIASPSVGQVVSPLNPANAPDTTQLATKSEVAAVSAAIPKMATTTPLGVADTGAAGASTTEYAGKFHTHASKARRIIATSAADGSYTYNYSATPFASAPVCNAVAEVAAGVTDVVNVQIVGTPTATSASFLVNRANRSTAVAVGLNVLSVPAQPGATKLHILCLEP
jgi:hypothetical protein